MSLFTLGHLFDHFQFAFILEPNILGSYAVLFFIASDFTSITGHIHNWALFLLWLKLFFPPGASSPLSCSSILGTYQPREFIFQCHIFLHFHIVYGILKVRMLKWFAIPFSSGPHPEVMSKMMEGKISCRCDHLGNDCELGNHTQVYLLCFSVVGTYQHVTWLMSFKFFSNLLGLGNWGPKIGCALSRAWIYKDLESQKLPSLCCRR